MNRTWINEGLSAPPAFHIDDEVHASEQQEGEATHTHHVRQRPEETDALLNFTPHTKRPTGCISGQGLWMFFNFCN